MNKSEEKPMTIEQLNKVLKEHKFEFPKYYDNGMVMFNGTYMRAKFFDKALSEELLKEYTKLP
jgi:hypothetical protein